MHFFSLINNNRKSVKHSWKVKKYYSFLCKNDNFDLNYTFIYVDFRMSNCRILAQKYIGGKQQQYFYAVSTLGCILVGETNTRG